MATSPSPLLRHVRSSEAARRRPLWVHAAALALLLVALVPVVGTGSSFSADEGAAIIQARSLAAGHGWIVEHPLPEVDPAGIHYPYELAERGPAGTTAFARHPAHVLLLAVAERAGGVPAMVGLSILGAVLAAVGAAALARRLDTRLARPTLWTVGVGTPLFFDSFLVVAHTLGAAFAVTAVVAALAAVERRSLVAWAAAGAASAGAVLVRTEALLFALALAVATVVVLRRWSRTWALATGLAVLGGAAFARLAEIAAVRAIVGGIPVGTGRSGESASGGWLGDRVDAFVLTWLRPSYGDIGARELALLLAAIAVGLACWKLRGRGPGESRAGVGAVAAAGAAAAALALVLDPGGVVPGLLVASPLLVAGLASLRREAWADARAALPLLGAGLFAAGVVLFQYPDGGSGEWGGRYFALALPVAVPPLLGALAHALGRSRPHPRRIVAGALLACTAALALNAVGALRATHRHTAELVATLDGVAARAGVPRPVVVTTEGAAPRFGWASQEDLRWLRAEPHQIPALVARLTAAGVDRFVVVSRAEGVDVGAATELDEVRHGDWRVLLARA